MISQAKTVNPELLAPAGDLEKLRFAYAYGADAAYAGAGDFSLRAGSGFSLAEIGEGVELAHRSGKKLYLALNAFLRDEDLMALPPYLESLSEIGPDGLIVSDPGVFRLCRRHAPDLPLHISTQANNMSSETMRFWADLGASRVVLARELSLEQAAAAAVKGIESEIFVHGAICISYSGRCLISSYLTGRSANRGDCAQSCRWRFALCEEKRPGEYYHIEEDSSGSYFFNSRDLCLLPFVPRLMEGGFASWKIEGRNKSAYYVANTVRIYRAAMDSYRRGPSGWICKKEWLQELAKVSHRRYTSNFAVSKPGADAFMYDDSRPVRRYDFAAVALSWENGLLRLEQRNHITKGDELEILLPDGEAWSVSVDAIYNEAGTRIYSANHPKEIICVPSRPLPKAGPLICRRVARNK